jgi:F0F1-type ATP synthase membrane subunit c/vacuolar-type H+-ATPase subunit K
VHSWRERLAVFGFALAVLTAIVVAAFATGYIIGKLIL